LRSSSLLNVPKDATNEQITSHYRAFVVLYHPDKQRSPENRAAAEATFRRIQKAYEGPARPLLPRRSTERGLGG
jgi:DnaJ-class molecular chaperone